MRIEASDLRRILPPLDAITGPNAYAARVGQGLAALFEASHVVFIDWSRANASPENLAVGDVHFINWAPARKQVYYESFRNCDPISRWCIATQRATSPGAIRVTDILPMSQFRASAFFQALLRPENLRYVMTLALTDGDRLTGDFSLVRDARCRDFDAAEIELAHALIPALSLAWSETARRRSMATLTVREHEVVEALGRGLANKQIARRLGLSPWTVKNHLKVVFEKTGATNRTELCALLHRRID